MNWETELVLDRACDETRQENMAQAHRDNGEEQCEECGEWVDEEDLALYQGQHLCPDCHRGYILESLENLKDDIEAAFSHDVWIAARALISAMDKETKE
ncbi:MAG: hypothetical protein LBK66_01240 [Spirochaetaceae bacterium]|jgi:hypothetical protein|nr:hypothetical protein [Spirochaetaceae bacterium]